MISEKEGDEMIRLRRLMKDEKGFTLIELLVVIAILGIVAGLAVPRVVGAIDKAKTNSDKANAQALEAAVERYYIDQIPNAYPATLNDLKPNYIKEVPTRSTGSWSYDSVTGSVY